MGTSSQKRTNTQTRKETVGSTLNAGKALSVVARGDNAEDAQNGSLSAVAGSLSGRDVVLAASKDITLQAADKAIAPQSGVETTQTKSSSNSFGISAGVVASVGAGADGVHAGASVTASVGGSTQHAKSDSKTHVVTTVDGANSVRLLTPGETTLNGALVSGGHIGVQTGKLAIISPQDEAHYGSRSTSGGASITVPIPGAGLGPVGGGASMSHTSITDEYRSTGKQQSGIYAGEGGLDVEVSGDTHLTGGVISSTAQANRNRFETGSLTAESVENVSRWSGTTVSAGGGYVQGQPAASVPGTSTVAVGYDGHNEKSVTESVITGNIAVQSGSTTGQYSTDLIKANGHLENDFNAKKLNTTLQIQTAAETLAESAYQVGKNLYQQSRSVQSTTDTGNGNHPQSGETQKSVSGRTPNSTSGSSSIDGQSGSRSSDAVNTNAGIANAGSQTTDSFSAHGASLEQGADNSEVRPNNKFWSDAQHTLQPGGAENWQVTGGRNKPFAGMGDKASARAFWLGSANALDKISNLPEGWGLIGSVPLAGMQVLDGNNQAALRTLLLAGPGLVGLGAQARIAAFGLKGAHTGLGVAERGLGSGALALVRGGRGTVTVGEVAAALKSPLAQKEAKEALNTALKAYQAYQNIDATTGEQHTSSDQTGGGGNGQEQSTQQAASAETVGADSLPPNGEEPSGEESKQKPNPKLHEGAQGKHLEGHRNYDETRGRSVITEDPEELLQGVISGKYKIIREGNGKYVVDFGKKIGRFGGASGPESQFGTVHTGKNGSHIVPANPSQW
ncbi:hemagglutinin repeat-containing protein [Asaia astilbis]